MGIYTLWGGWFAPHKRWSQSKRVLSSRKIVLATENGHSLSTSMDLKWFSPKRDLRGQIIIRTGISLHFRYCYAFIIVELLFHSLKNLLSNIPCWLIQVLFCFVSVVKKIPLNRSPVSYIPKRCLASPKLHERSARSPCSSCNANLSAFLVLQSPRLRDTMIWEMFGGTKFQRTKSDSAIFTEMWNWDYRISMDFNGFQQIKYADFEPN